MQQRTTKYLFTCFLIALSTNAFGGDPIQVEPREAVVKPKIPNATMRQMTFSNAFRVKEVRFDKVVINNQEHLAAAVIFNKEIDAATVQQNTNIRLLKQDSNNFWVDASTQNNNVNVRPKFITWLSGTPIEAGVKYKMHLRGTIHSSDGVSLDCDGDGNGEGGQLPAYESQIYLAPGRILEGIEDIRN